MNSGLLPTQLLAKEQEARLSRPDLFKTVNNVVHKKKREKKNNYKRTGDQYQTSTTIGIFRELICLPSKI